MKVIINQNLNLILINYQNNNHYNNINNNHNFFKRNLPFIILKNLIDLANLLNQVNLFDHL